MSVVKEYFNDKTKIKIHNDFINPDEKDIIKEIIISMMIENIKNKAI